MGVIYNLLLVLVYIAFIANRVVSHDFVHNPVSHYDVNDRDGDRYFDDNKKERCGSSDACSSDDESPKEENMYNYILIFTNPDIPSDPNCKGTFGDVRFPLHKSIKPMIEEQESDEPLDKRSKNCKDECAKRLDENMSSLLSWAQDKMKMNTMTISVQSYDQRKKKKKRHSHYRREKSRSLIPHLLRHVHRSHPRKYRQKRSMHADRKLDKTLSFTRHKNILRIHAANAEAQDDELDNTPSTPSSLQTSFELIIEDSTSDGGMEILRKVKDKTLDDIPIFELVPTQFVNMKDNLNFPTEGDYSWVTKSNVEDEDLIEIPKSSKSLIMEKISTTKTTTVITSSVNSTNATTPSKVKFQDSSFHEADNKKGVSSEGSKTHVHETDNKKGVSSEGSKTHVHEADNKIGVSSGGSKTHVKEADNEKGVSSEESKTRVHEADNKIGVSSGGSKTHVHEADNEKGVSSEGSKTHVHEADNKMGVSLEGSKTHVHEADNDKAISSEGSKTHVHEADNKTSVSLEGKCQNHTHEPSDTRHTSTEIMNHDSNAKGSAQGSNLSSSESSDKNGPMNSGNSNSNPSVKELMALLSALKEQFLHSMLDTSTSNDDSPNGVPNLQNTVEEMFTQIQEYDNQNNFIAVINGGNVSDLKNCSSDLVKTLHYINKNSDPSSTVVIVTGSCPTKEIDVPLLVNGPKTNLFRRVRELCDIPLTIEMHIKHARANRNNKKNNNNDKGDCDSRCNKEVINSYSNAKMINQLFESFPNDFGSRFANERQLAESLVAPFDHWYDEMAPNVIESDRIERKVKRDITDETKKLDNGSSCFICASNQILALISFMFFNFLFE